MKKKIKTRENELSQLKSTSEKDVAFITVEFDTIDTRLKDSIEKNMKVKEEIKTLQELAENLSESIFRMEQEKKTKKNLIERTLANSRDAQDNLTGEIENLRASLDSRLKTVDSLMSEGVTEPVISSEKQRLSEVRSEITEKIKRKREEIETEMENLEELELEENKRGKLTVKCIEYEEPEVKVQTKQKIKQEIKPEATEKDLEIKPKKEELIRSLTDTDYDIKLEPSLKLELEIPVTVEEEVILCLD